MEKETRIRTMYCPLCAKQLRGTEKTKKLLCPYCECIVRPVLTAPQTANHTSAQTVPITSVAAAESYARYFFDSFDWQAWSLTKEYTIAETDSLAQRFAKFAGHEKGTWLLAFDCLFTPIIKKTESFAAVLDSIAALMANNKRREAVAMLDSLQQAASHLIAEENNILRQVVTYTENARKCAATEDELNVLYEKIQSLRNAFQSLQIPAAPEEIGSVKAAAEKTNAALTEEFAEIGMDLEIEYRRVGNFLHQKQYTQALSVLQRIKGYKNTATILSELTRTYQFREVLQITGRLYIYRANDKFGGALFAVENGKPAAEPLAKGIMQILAVHANLLFFVDAKNKLFWLDLSEKSVAEFDRKRSFPDLIVYKTDNADALYFAYRSRDGKGAKVLSEFRPADMQETVLYEDTAVIHGLNSGIVFYTDSNGETFAADLTGNKKHSVCRAKADLCAIIGNQIIYTRNAPSDDNKNLYRFTVGNNAQEELLAANIYEVCRIAGEKLYYTVGNKLQKSLYVLHTDDNSKKQLMKAVSEIAYADTDAVYAYCGDTYNRVLYRIACKNDSKTQVTDHIRCVTGMHCGKLFFINTDSCLCCVNPDGTALQTLFPDAEKVLLMRAGVIYFMAADDTQITQNADGEATIKQLLSLYAIRTDGTQLQKIVHGAADVKCSSDTEIDFFKSSATTDGNTANWLFRYDTKTGNTYKLLEYSVGGKKGK